MPSGTLRGARLPPARFLTKPELSSIKQGNSSSAIEDTVFGTRFRVPSLGVYLLFALSSLRESLSCSLRLPPLPLHGYPCGLLPPYPAPSIPLTLLLYATDWQTPCPDVIAAGPDIAYMEIQEFGSCTTNRSRPIVTTATHVTQNATDIVAISRHRKPRHISIYPPVRYITFRTWHWEYGCQEIPKSLFRICRHPPPLWTRVKLALFLPIFP